MRLSDFDIPCLFVSGKAPNFPMPDLALGCLMKPFTAEDVHRALGIAEDKLRGRETLLPYALSRWMMEKVNREDGESALFYFHPWEIDPGQPRPDGASAKVLKAVAPPPPNVSVRPVAIDYGDHADLVGWHSGEGGVDNFKRVLGHRGANRER